MDPELAAFHVLADALADCEHLLLHFRGPVCDLSVRPVTAVTGRLRDLLAGRAHQPGHSVLSPARTDRSGPVVRLPERGRIREPRPAPGHVAPGGRDPELVTNDAVLGDCNRPSQRIEADNRLPVFAVTARPEAE